MSKVNVLVVDDASFIRDLVKKCLRGTFPGIEIAEAANGKRAQQALNGQTFDLVLCDWEMPEMSGLELLVWFRAQPQHAATPFIMVTSRGDKENVIQAIQAGVSDYVGKPFTSEQLVGKVKKALAASGRLAALQSAPAPTLSTGTGGDSLSVLTGGRPAAAQVQPASAPVARPAPAAAPKAPAARQQQAPAMQSKGQAVLRMAEGELPCLIKAISLKDIVVMVKRGELLPQILSSVVVDLDEGELSQDVARLNAYIHSLGAIESGGDIQWVQAQCRFVDKDPQKLDYISRLIARGTTQKHFTPGA
ncbi:MAG: response regulator [Thiopseudomonas sp.]|nr:response regulator [Gammaproteobacteria bacterium]